MLGRWGCLFIKVVKLLSQLTGEPSSSFSVKVGLHKGSTLWPPLFIMIMDVLTEDVRDSLLTELLYADDLVLHVGIFR